MGLKLDMNKAEETAKGLRLALTKAGVRPDLTMDIAFDLDVSGSFDDEHRDGLTNDLMTRLVPLAMTFDPDKKIDVFTFSNGERYAHYVGEVIPETVEDYVRKNIIDKVPGYNGGTDYSYVLEKNLQHFGWAPAPQSSGGSSFFGFGKKSAAPATAEKRRSLIIFVTDGDNSDKDKDRTERILAESEARKDEVYFLFIAISNQGGNFPFLQKIGDRFSNTGLVVIRDLKKWNARSDENIIEELFQDELVEWLKK